MKKRNARASLILSSLAAIGVAGSLMAGATYALFTSESSVNIAVQSGKVDVKATIEALKTYSGNELVGNVDEDESKIVPTTTENVFENGGTATIDGGKLTLDRMTPGDRVTFEIKVKNNSNVSAKYRTKIMCDDGDGLFEGLKMTLNEQSYYGRTTISDYAELSAGSDPEKISVMIELPSDTGNEYQGKSCSISISVEAVQGNAATTDPEDGVFEIYTVSDLRYFQKNASDIKKTTYPNGVKLKNDLDLKNAEWTPIDWNAWDDSVFDGCEYTISNFVVNKDTRNGGLFGNTVNIHINNLKVDNATISGINSVGAIVGQGLCTYIDNCHVTNSVITASVYKNDDGDKAGGIVGQLTAQMSASLTNSSVDKCTIKAYRDLGGLAGHVQNKEAVVTNNKVTNTTVIQDFSVLSEDDKSKTVGMIVGRMYGTRDDETFVLDTESNTCDNVEIQTIKPV